MASKEKNVKLAIAQDMKKIDESAVKDYSLTMAGLMEKAGSAVVKALEETQKTLEEKDKAIKAMAKKIEELERRQK